MKQLSILILASLLLASCSDTSDVQTGKETDTVTETAVVTEEADPLAELFKIQPESNDGKVITVLTHDYHAYEMLAPEQNAELINDAVYGRNMAVEELLDVKFEVLTRPGYFEDRAEFWNVVSSSIMAGDGAHDIVCAMVSCMQPYATPEYYLDILTLEDVNLDNPWWVSSMKTDLSLQGKLICVIGDMNLSLYNQFPVVFANTSVLGSHDIDTASLYSSVNDGTWTFEKVFSLARGTEQDLNGDGKIEPEVDNIGLGIMKTPFWALQAAFDLHNITLDDGGNPYVVGLTERYANAAEYLASNIHGNLSVTIEGDMYEITETFAEGRGAFHISRLNDVEQMRNMEDNFAILPFPKLDEEQDTYRTLIATATNMTYIPVTVDDPALIGRVLESLAYYSCRDVVPAYYETALKERYSRDEETKKMLDIIRLGAVLPFEYAYSTALNDPHKVMALAVFDNTAGKLSSTIQARTKSWEKAIEKLMDSYTTDS